MKNNILINCSQLTKEFRKGDNVITPVNKLDLEVEKGTFLALMGPSGSGKTTLLNMIAGIDPPTSGDLIIEGQNLTGMSRSSLTKWRGGNVGYIFQLYHLIPVLTAYENIELPLLISGMSSKERHQRIASCLEMVNLADRSGHYPRQLSGGQEQRVAIARALVIDPPLIVADEPTGDLDGESAASILKLLRMLVDDLGKTIVMVTHDPKAAKQTDLTLHLEKGQLVREEENVHL